MGEIVIVDKWRFVKEYGSWSRNRAELGSELQKSYIDGNRFTEVACEKSEIALLEEIIKLRNK